MIARRHPASTAPLPSALSARTERELENLLPTSAFAKTRMPETITCTSNATSENVRSFSLIDLDTTRPDSSIEDTSLMGYELSDGVMNMGLSNECDNSYDITISLTQIEEMVSGERKTVMGKLNYSDVALSEARNTDRAGEETVEITCRL